MNVCCRVACLALFSLLVSAAVSSASTCIDCHTDAAKLKSIAANLPQPPTSAETKGKG